MAQYVRSVNALDVPKYVHQHLDGRARIRRVHSYMQTIIEMRILCMCQIGSKRPFVPVK
jgi:hypothetical protein